MSIRDIILELDFPIPGKLLQSGPLFKGGREGGAGQGNYCVCLCISRLKKGRNRNPNCTPLKGAHDFWRENWVV